MFKIGDLANISGVSIQTIRFYEKEGLIAPVEVDRWTNYRYFDEKSIERLAEITYLKDLGFSLKEIKNLSEDVIQQKINQTRKNIVKLSQNINALSSIRKEGGNFIMKKFVNDSRVIGKWEKVAVVKNKEDFYLQKFDDKSLFSFNELYFLPKGEEYWVLKWTKGSLFIKDRECPYEIIDEKLFIGIRDFETGEIDGYAVYKKVDSNIYKKNEIRVKDNTDLPFVYDERVIGFWTVVDCVKKPEQFNPKKKFFKDKLFLKKYAFEPNGRLLQTYGDRNTVSERKWTKKYVINEQDSTTSEYTIKKIGNDVYMIIEWKSGDYMFGGEVRCYYVLKKENKS